MAIYLRRNVVELVRSAKCPYWKIFETEAKKTAGNYVTSADFEVADLGINAACDELTAKLSCLSQGRYIITAYEKNDGKRKGVDSWIELEPGVGLTTPISGIGSTETTGFVIAGFGVVTPDNFEQAIESKMAGMLAKQREADHLKALELEVKALKLEIKENNTGLNKGLVSVGTVMYGAMSKSPHFKDVIGLIGDVTKAANGMHPNDTELRTVAEELPQNHQEGETAEIGGVAVNQDRLFSALDKIANNNPDVLAHLEKLGNLRQRDPDTYNSGLDILDTL
ncbi:MAG: hypothetical protein H7320_13115 [Ferruginibacter sp.]|nr:hypothetical protein [Ferruginibacter sp.]